jgi:hypothetical protein
LTVLFGQLMIQTLNLFAQLNCNIDF